MKTTTQLWMFGQDVLVEPADLVGYEVEAADGEIGKVHKSSEDTNRRFLVVDTGFWIFGKKRMVPAGFVSRIDRDAERVFISMTKDQVKDAPDFDDEEARRYADDEYNTFGSYYSGLP
jgi:hypothetical protein